MLSIRPYPCNTRVNGVKLATVAEDRNHCLLLLIDCICIAACWISHNKYTYRLQYAVHSVGMLGDNNAIYLRLTLTTTSRTQNSTAP